VFFLQKPTFSVFFLYNELQGYFSPKQENVSEKQKTVTEGIQRNPQEVLRPTCARMATQLCRFGILQERFYLALLFVRLKNEGGARYAETIKLGVLKMTAVHNQVKMQDQQSYTGKNGVQILYPKGYQSFQAYVATLRINLKIAERNLKLQKFVPRILEDIASAESALGLG
jgi:hypothetical protein